MLMLYGLTSLILAVSLLVNPGKTARGLRIALRRFLSTAPGFVLMLMLVVVTFQLLPDHTIVRLLAHENRWSALAGALGLGSVSIMPGFVAFPLCAIMLDRGALYMVLSAFSTTLMMVGVVTFPVEKAYLGTRLALARNAVSLAIAIAVAVVTGLVFGELR